MSSIYNQEPPTNGKVLLETTAGDIDIELWSREAPKACRNFIQLCMENYYDGTPFHRLVQGFIVQGGDPTGTGRGGNSIWGKPFKDEFHSRLRFSRRGLVAMANSGKDDNGSQFFFTLGPTPELQSKHTIFGKIAGDTIYNLSKFEDGEIDEDEKPLFPHKIIKTRILSNPFDDITPREVIKKEKPSSKNKSTVVGTKNYKLLSFGEEAEEEEEEVSEVNKKFSGKGKSSHDLTSDPKLSSVPALDRRVSSSNDNDEEEKDDQLKTERTLDSVKEKLKKRGVTSKSSRPKLSGEVVTRDGDGDEETFEDGDYYLGKDEELENKRKVEKIQNEFKKLKREIKKSDQDRARAHENIGAESGAIDDKLTKLAEDNSLIKSFYDEQKKYKEKKSVSLKAGSDREAQTLALLSKFQSKLSQAKETFPEAELPNYSDKSIEGDDADVKDDDTDISWLARKLENKDDGPVVAKDASLKTDDWFEIYDPRNPINKRRRAEKDKAGESTWKKSKMLT